MKFATGATTFLVAAGTAGLASAYPTAGSSYELDARDVPNELSLRALYEVKRRAEEHAELVGRAYDDLDNQLFRRWGSGKYKLDDDTYHRVVKPKFIQAFDSKKFRDFCGKNPDFFIESDGFVYPGAASNSKKNGDCNKKKFPPQDLGHIVLEAQPKSRSPSPAPSKGKGKREYVELAERAYDDLDGQLFRRWGSGKYKLDDDTYHRVVKPKFIQAFDSKKFRDFCGKNPDFFIESDGFVYPGAASNSKKNGDCNKKKFPPQDLGHIVLEAQPKSRSPSPEPSRGKGKREYIEIDELD